MTAAGHAAIPPLRKWYFCINARGFATYLALITAAVASARSNTGLIPHCLYDGTDPGQIATLERMGVRVIRTGSSFEDALRQGYGDQFEVFCGHWLRVDLPLIEREDALVLYTDVDVMFLAPPVVTGMPRYLAAAPEFDQGNRRYFSSGVMLLNLPALRQVHGAFVAAIRQRLTGDFRYPAHDQESFNRFFGHTLRNRLRGRTFDPMPPENNWKPFWGLGQSPAIVHFHGPKPGNTRAFANGQIVPHQSKLAELWRMAPGAYEQYSAIWDGFLHAGRHWLAAPA